MVRKVIAIGSQATLLFGLGLATASAAALHATTAQVGADTLVVNDTDPGQGDRVRRIAARLVPQASRLLPGAPVAWRFDVVDPADPSAGIDPFQSAACVYASASTGYSVPPVIGVLTKLKSVLPSICVNLAFTRQVSDDELAGTIAHEMGHLMRARGLPDLLPHSSASKTYRDVAGWVYSQAPEMVEKVLELGYLLSVRYPEQRLEEEEADRVGLELTQRAGFDPRGLTLLFARLPSLPSWISDHPSASDRTLAAERYLAERAPSVAVAANNATTYRLSESALLP